MRAPSLIALSSLLIALAGCTAGGGDRPPGNGGDPRDGGGSAFDGAPPPRWDAAGFDPFDPDNACGSTTIPTQRVPGSLLLIFDRSGSMNNPPSGDSGPTMWDMATGAINDVIGGLSDELNMGLQLFPYAASGSDNCTVEFVAGQPNVPIGPLATTGPMIGSALSGSSPSGGTTPLYEATRNGYRYLDTISTTGQRGLIVVTDGGENCHSSQRVAFLDQVADEFETNGYLTYAVGLNISNNDLSTMAFNGGTPRHDLCRPVCRNPSCFEDTECASGDCVKPSDLIGFPIPLPGGFEEPGECSCRTDTPGDCPSHLTCTSQPFIGNQCTGEPDCCHYDASGASFRAEFESALDDIARRFLENCVFDLPRGTDPDSFDPNQVNVGVTFSGESRTVLGRSSDNTNDSWNYTSPSHESIIIQGPICDRLIGNPAEVEIVLGCPTILY